MSQLKRLTTVTLDPAKCKGCLTCMKRCPTEAIRVRDGIASVMYDKCVGCGECVRLCPHHAKIPSYDKFEIVNGYKYKIALPAPSFYGQFNNLHDVNYVLTGLKRLGFDDVFEVGRGAEISTLVTQILLNKGHIPQPIISTACPAVLELINARFSNLKKHLLNVLPPVDISAKLAREKAVRLGYKEEEIGVFFISPCPAKVYALKSGMGVKVPYVNGVLSSGEMYMKLLPVMKLIDHPENLCKMGVTGLSWASSGGEAAAAMRDKYLAADGIENVIRILESIENGTLNEIEFIELNACTGGCVGGVLNVENPFVAKARLRQLRIKFPQIANSLVDLGKSADYYLTEKEDEVATPTLDTDRATAFVKLLEIQEMHNKLPQNDCGLCGAPSCRAFCEDVVTGRLPKDTVCPQLKKDN